MKLRRLLSFASGFLTVHETDSKRIRGASKFFSRNVFQGTIMFKRKLWEKYGPLNTDYKYMFEYILFDQFFKFEKGVFINEFLAKYRIHQQAISSKYVLIGNQEKEKLKRNNNKMLHLFFKIRRVFFYIIDNNMSLWFK